MDRNDELKIHLSREDALYIRQKIINEADRKVKHHIPTTSTSNNDEDSDQSEDPLYTRVNELIHGFVNDAFDMAGHGVIVDGESFKEGRSISKILEQTSEEDQIEPFDLELSERLRSLYSQVDAMTLEISMLRRQVPKEILEKHMTETDMNIPELSPEHAIQVTQDPELQLSSNKKEILEKIQENQAKYYNILNALEQLKNADIPNTQIQVEQGLNALDFFS